MLKKSFLGLLFVTSFGLLAGKNNSSHGAASSAVGLKLYGTANIGSARLIARHYEAQVKKNKTIQKKSRRAQGSCCSRFWRKIFGY